MASSNNRIDQKNALKILIKNFRAFPDKEKAWDDLYNLMSTEWLFDGSYTIYSNSKHQRIVPNLIKLESIYSWAPNKEQIWDDLCSLIPKLDPYDKSSLLDTLKSICYLNLNKYQVWSDIFELSKVETTIIISTTEYEDLDGHIHRDDYEKLNLPKKLSEFLIYICEQVSDKEKIWKDVCKAYEENNYNGLYILTSHIDLIENKIMMWDDIIKLSLLEYNDKSTCVQLLDYIKKLNIKIENKDKVWNDLCRLLKMNTDIGKQISEIMSSTFRLVSDKDKAWNELYRLAKNDNRKIRNLSVDIMESVIYFVPKRSVNYAVEDLKEIKYLRELKHDIKVNPHIINVNISKTDIDFVRVAAIQIDFNLNDDFPYKIKGNHENVKNKVISAIKEAKTRDAHIICLPELSLCEEWLPEIIKIGKGSIIIPGSFYNEKNQNICPIIMDNNNDVPPHIKIAPSNDEMEVVAGEGMIPGDTIHIYNTLYGRFAILICRDFIQNFTMSLDVDMIFVISYNGNIKRYKEFASDFVINNPSFVIISNVSHFGGTSIFGQLHKKYHSKLEKNGHRDKGDNSSIICRLKAGDEKIIIADLNLTLKTISKVSSNVPDKKYRSIGTIEILDIL